MKEKRSFLNIIPTIGICLFFTFFVYSASIYPGGSQADFKSVGYSWINNYWCELMNSVAMNNSPNPAMPFAITGMICLSVGLSVFFCHLPFYCPTNKGKKLVIQICGVIGTVFAALLFTDYHSEMLLGFSIFTFITIIAALAMLFENGCRWQFWSGVIGISLVQLVNFMYYLRIGIDKLPLIQKFTIAYVLIWIMLMNLTFVFNACRKES